MSDIYTLIRDELEKVYTPEGCDIWLDAEHEQFGGKTVSQMLSLGRGQEVLAAIDRLASGAFG